MEFLRTPDPAAAWAVTPRAPTAVSNPTSITPVSSTPATTAAAAVAAPHLDRNSIKSSFQTLFTPNVASTPHIFAKPSAPSGLTPFINGVVTPNFVTPAIGMLPMTTTLKDTVSTSATGPSPDVLLSSPYLQAAAKEAVRREFMNMPTYIAAQPALPTAPNEQTVPAAQTPAQTRFVYAKDGGLVVDATTTTTATAPTPSRPTPSAAQPSTSPDGEARVPEARPAASSTDSGEESPAKPSPADPTSPGNQRVPQASTSQPSSAAAHPRTGQSSFGDAQRPFYQMQPQQGVFLMPQNGAMVPFPPPGNAFYMHPGSGMVMFAPPGAPPHQMLPPPPPGVVVHPVHPSHMLPASNRAPMKPETAAERKHRIEREKQELIREFKKKTREAALVRFRQKRRERRFGKLIRYDCRKKLADARPRVKGRFVRIKTHSKDDTEDSAQVVPSME